MTVTFQCRLDDRSLYPLFDACGDLYGRVERSLLAALRRGEDLNDLKREYIARFGITARQFNAVRVSVQGRIASAQQLRKVRISELGASIRRTEKTIRKLKRAEKSLAAKLRRAQRGIADGDRVAARMPVAALHQPDLSERLRKIRFQLHGKQRRLRLLQDRLQQVRQDGTVSICLGSRKLFRQQYDPEMFPSHEQWLAAWRQSRSGQFFCLGSKDESHGNQSCALSPARVLRLRVPPALSAQFGKYVWIPGLRFPYGQEVIDRALAAQQAISYRLVRRVHKAETVWYLFVSTERTDPEPESDIRLGVVGIDLNHDHLAVTESDRFGNIVAKRRIPLRLYHRSSGQVRGNLGVAVAEAVGMARAAGKPVVIEELDFAGKRAALREDGPRRARLLSGFAYRTLRSYLMSRAAREGVRVIGVDPAYSSFIGQAKYGQGYRLSRHHAAALVIARRGLGLCERYGSRNATLPPVDGRVHGEIERWRALYRQRLHESKEAGGRPSRSRLLGQNSLQSGCEPRTRATGATVPPAPSLSPAG